MGISSACMKVLSSNSCRLRSRKMFKLMSSMIQSTPDTRKYLEHKMISMCCHTMKTRQNHNTHNVQYLNFIRYNE